MADVYMQACLLVDLVESSTNPRKHRNATADEELRNSILEVGVLEPILVRAIANGADAKFEIIAGSRRYRAAKDAGLEAIPAILKTLTDAEALEVQIVENLQRQDVHPLDEADGYAALIASGYTISNAALKLGKSERFVASRLALCKLVPQLRRLLDEDKISLGVALEAARQTAADQEEFTKRFHLSNDGAWLQNVSVEAAKSFFRTRVTDLSRATWDLADAALLPVAGACNVCPKRTGALGALFEDVPDSCQDSKCFGEKQARFIDQQRAALAEKTKGFVEIVTGGGGDVDGEQRVDIADVMFVPPDQKKRCKNIKAGLIVDGPGAGKTLDVCTDPECPIHHHAVNDDGTVGEDLTQDVIAPKPVGGGDGKWKEEEKKRKAEKAAQTKRAREASAVRTDRLAKYLGAGELLASTTMTKVITQRAGDLLIARLAWGEAAAAVKALGITLALATSDEDAKNELRKELDRAIDSKSDSAVNRVFLAVLVADEIHIPEYVTKIPPCPTLDLVAGLVGDYAAAQIKAAKGTGYKLKNKKTKPADVVPENAAPCAKYTPFAQKDSTVCVCGFLDIDHADWPKPADVAPKPSKAKPAKPPAKRASVEATS